MTTQTTTSTPDTWLARYYSVRAAFSIAWVAAAFALASSTPVIVSALLLIYPAWDAAANLVDAHRSGGLTRNPTQLVNAVVSVGVTAAVAVANSPHAVLTTFGVWAIFSGLLQLATGARRRRGNGGQWPMILSGAQSTLAGAMFVAKASAPHVVTITTVAQYAAFGAFYFLVAALWLARSIRLSSRAPRSS
ncbi:DUF308 domain-containing protein [Mycobacterium sp.]|uniref:DUF308 domain-containing protein n=1 Tax=Mycobacterium sp. TaxID=1785 RepID=UPI0025FABC3D|nr:DUF308 domain-containing protein [Mycobacterium sp.]